MRKRLVLVGLAGLLAVLGAGYARSVGQERPTHQPNPNVADVYVAGPDGEALKCNGQLVKVNRSALGGRTPPLTPAQAARQSALAQPPVKVARCERGASGQETGRVVFVDEAAADTP
ncbi:MAG: hypothetical protein ACXW0F_12375 [Gaiellaceae bacterium]